MTRFAQFAAALLFILQCVAVSAGDDRINIILGTAPPLLEEFAATEMAAQFKRLFNAEVIVTEWPETASSTHRVLIGSPATNALVQADHAGQWPELSDQGICIRSVASGDGPAIIVGGGSPVATMWAAYEVGHHFGVRYLLHGDILPPQKVPLDLDGLDIVMEPQFRDRAWETLGPFACGHAAWILEEHRRALCQLAKLKYNRVVLAFAPWQPFVHYEFREVSRTSARPWHGGPFRVDGDTAGREVFQGATEYAHPDLAAGQSYVDITQAGVALARGIISAAHQLGMTATIAISPLEFPTEFDGLLPDAVPRGPESLAIGPGPEQSPDDPVLLALAKTKIQAYLSTYPHVDAIQLNLPAVSAWTGHHLRAWRMLRDRSLVGDGGDLQEWLAAVDGQLERESLQSELTALACLGEIVSDSSLFKRASGGDIPIVIAGANSALRAGGEHLLLGDVALLHGVNESAHELAADTATLEASIAAPASRSSLVLTLHDRNVGPLPQCYLHDIHRLITVLRGKQWNGFLTRYPVIGDSAPVMYYLSRAGFDAQMTPERALDQFFTAICGAGTVAAMTKCYDLLEQATDVICENDPTIAFPMPGMVMAHYTSADPPPGWWKEAKTLYLQSLSEEGRAIERTEIRGKPYLLFLIKRLVLGFSHFGILESLRESGSAGREQDLETAIEKFEAALESVYGSAHALASQARYRSDLGTIAILNAYGYHPLLEELQALYEAEEDLEEP